MAPRTHLGELDVLSMTNHRHEQGLNYSPTGTYDRWLYSSPRCVHGVRV